MALAEDIKQKATELGFDIAGITDASPIDAEQVELLAGWLASNFAGRMSYMHRNFEKRINPAKLLKDAQSVIVVGLNYRPPRQKLKPSNPAAPMGKVANYAQYEDYHSFIKKRLHKLIDFIISLVGEDLQFKICVDSAPLAERAFAARAGLGFIGKNHMLINPKFGSQIFLGEIITSLKLELDEPITNNCSDCNKCIDACPTGALRPDGQFDANRCISYLTTVRQGHSAELSRSPHRPEQPVVSKVEPGRRIEYKDCIPTDLAKQIADRLFGCDECILACPYQENAPVCQNKQFKFYADRAELNLQEISDLSQTDFDAKFADSVIKRLGLERLKRNAQICLKNIAGSSF